MGVGVDGSLVMGLLFGGAGAADAGPAATRTSRKRAVRQTCRQRAWFITVLLIGDIVIHLLERTVK